MTAAGVGETPGPGSYGSSLTESWLAASLPSDIPVPAFGSSIARSGPFMPDHTHSALTTQISAAGLAKSYMYKRIYICTHDVATSIAVAVLFLALLACYEL